MSKHVYPTEKMKKKPGETLEEHVRRVLKAEGKDLSDKAKIVLYAMAEFEHEGIIPTETQLFARAARVEKNKPQILTEDH